MRSAAIKIIESFNGRLRDELLNETLFRSPCRGGSLATDYNEARPYYKLGWLTPGTYASPISGEL